MCGASSSLKLALALLALLALLGLAAVGASARPEEPRGPWLVPWDDPVGDRPLVRTSKGLVRGVTQMVSTGKFADAFLGVPYAKPPVGERRFRRPEPPDAWPGELGAERLPNSCYQLNDTFFGANFAGTYVWNANTNLSEDCLYLNVWAPFGSVLAHSRRPSGESNHNSTSINDDSNSNSRPAEDAGASDRKPVMVWIFGGGFYSGTSSLALYDGGVLATEEDVLVVSLNYRVSALGFLYLNQSGAPGNAGLYDQLLALEWVRDNIAQFGGDPHRVTIFGESAGAVSVSYHLLSPLSRHLFARAILQSGAAVCDWCHREPAELLANSLRLAHKLNCSHHDHHQQQLAPLECLLRADARELVSQRLGRTGALINFPFAPLVDGAFLPERPELLLRAGRFKRADLLLGSNENEGNSWLVYLADFSECPAAAAAGPCKPKDRLQLRRHQLERLVNEDLVEPAQRPLIRRAILHEYTNWLSQPLDRPSEDNEALDKIVGDYYFTCPVNSFGQFYADHGNRVYMYHFEQRSSTSPWPRWMGVLHGDEISYIFGEPLNPRLNYTRAEVDLSRRMMGYWASFARTGNPVANRQGKEESWPSYTGQLQHYFQLRADGFGLGLGPRTRHCAFWAGLVDQMRAYLDRCAFVLDKQELRNEPAEPALIQQPGLVAFLLLGLLVLAGVGAGAWLARRQARLGPADADSSSGDQAPID